LPEIKGFSERNLDRMIAFYRAYPNPSEFSPPPTTKSGPVKVPQVAAKSDRREISPQVAAKLPDSLLWAIPWFHHVILMEKVKDLPVRLWYMQETLSSGWSRNVLTLMVKSGTHARHGKAITNFERLLPAPQSDLVQQTLKNRMFSIF
jgi:hypothetical protein